MYISDNKVEAKSLKHRWKKQLEAQMEETT